MAKRKTAPAKPGSGPTGRTPEPETITLGKAIGKHRTKVRREDGTLIGYLRGATDFGSMAEKFRVDALAMEVQRLAGAGAKDGDGINPDDPQIAECGQRFDELFAAVFEVAEGAQPPDAQEREEILGRFFERAGSTLSNNPVIRRLMLILAGAEDGGDGKAAE